MFHQTNTLTTGIDTSGILKGSLATTSTDGNDTFVGLHTTMTALDTLDGGAGTDTLLYIDDSAAGTPLAVQFSNIETVAVRNLSGDAATTASAETATVGFQALAAGQTVIIASVTFTAGSSGATAAEVAAAFAAPATAANDTATIATANTLVVNGGTLTGITAATTVTEAAAAALVVDKIAAGGYTAAAGGQVNSVKFTSNAATPTNVTDLAVTGTAVTGIAQVTKIAITTEASAAMTLVINGDSVAVADGANLKADATNIANAINTYLGQVVAVVVPDVSSAVAVTNDHNVIVTTNSIVNIASVTGTSLVAPITNTQPFAAAAAPTVTIVDGVAAVTASTNAMTVDASAFEGVTTIMNTASTDAVTFSGMTEIATLAVEKVTAGALATTTANFDADLTNGTADAVSVSLSGNTSAGTITIGAGFETVNVSAAGTNTVAGLVTGAKTVNITGAGNLKITAAIADATKIDGSAATGKLDVETAVNEVTVSTGSGADKIELSHAASVALEATVNAGAGNDTVTITSLDGVADLVDNKVTIDGGAGTDTLVMTEALAETLSALTAAEYAKKGITNFEKLTISTALDAAVNTERLGLTTDVTLKAGSTTGAALNNMVSGATVAFGGVHATQVVAVGIKGAADAGRNADVLNLVLSAEQTADTSYGTVTAASVETINIDSSTGNDALTSFANTLKLVATSAETINISGGMKFELVADSALSTNFVALDTVNASGNTAGVSIDLGSTTPYTKAVTITGTAKADTITGGDGNDVINAGAGNDIIVGGLGNDVINGGAGDDTITGGIGKDTLTGGDGADTFVFTEAAIFGTDAAAVADVITDFVVGTDKLQLSGTGGTLVVSAQQGAVQAAVTALAAGSTDHQIATAMANTNTTNEGVSFAVFNGNTYVYHESVGATTTHDADANMFIQLTGVTTLPLFANDVIA